MSKNKYLGVAWVILSVVALGGGGFAFLHARGQHHVNSYGAESINSGAATSQNQSLDQNGSSSSANSGLSVGGSNSNSGLNQLGNGSGQSPLGSSGTGSSSSSSSSGSAPTLPDPSTFAQYEKYKTGTSALFADIQVGTGAELGTNQKAAVYYRGFLTNGSVFDQTKAGSDGKTQPFVFQMGAHQVITGWEQGFAGMKVGGVRLIIVPPSVGYGATAQGSIPANSVLVFEVQLLQVQ